MTKAEWVLDSSAAIRSDSNYSSGGYLTPNSVMEELRTDESRLAVELAVEKELVRVLDPGEEYVKEVTEAASVTGDSLSSADVDVLALALEHNATVLSDDYGIQNVARRLGVKYHPVAQQGIKKELTWVMKCPGCGRKYDITKSECSVCGTQLKKKGF